MRKRSLARLEPKLLASGLTTDWCYLEVCISGTKGEVGASERTQARESSISVSETSERATDGQCKRDIREPVCLCIVGRESPKREWWNDTCSGTIDRMLDNRINCVRINSDWLIVVHLNFYASQWTRVPPVDRSCQPCPRQVPANQYLSLDITNIPHVRAATKLNLTQQESPTIAVAEKRRYVRKYKPERGY